MSDPIIRYSVDGINWQAATLNGEPSTSVLFHRVSVLCDGCPPYEPIIVAGVTVAAKRSTASRGKAEVAVVNPVTEFTDNMWCRRGSTITSGGVKTQGIRVDGIED